MLKVKGVEDNTFGVVAYSKPYSYGYLNQQVKAALSNR
jgi:hypothetical protein